MKKNQILPLIILFMIFAGGLGLRLYRLNLNVPPLYADETGHYLVLQNIFHNRSNVIEFLINISFTSTFIFGLNPFGVRVLSAVYGSFLILFMYIIGLNLSGGNKKVGLTCSLMSAIMPWNIMISRIGLTHIGIILILICTHFFLYLRSKKISDLLICLIPLGAATIYYPSVIAVLPFILLMVVIDIYVLLEKKYQKYFVGIFIISLIGFGIYISNRQKIFSNSGRMLDLAIWRDVNTPWEIDKYRALSWNSTPSPFSFGFPPEQLANKLVYNRVVANLSVFTHNYFSFFSPEWLFFKGDAILRHSTGQVGSFYPFLIPFMLYGTFVFFSTASQKNKIIFLTWILASPISAAITKDGAGYLLRIVTMLPFLTYFCALGVVESFYLIKRNWRIPYGAMILLIGLYSGYYFFYGYFHVYPSLSARSYEYGFKELSDFQVTHQNNPLLVVWDGYYHNNDFRFWQNTPFNQYQSFKLKETVVGGSHFYQTFPNLYFVNPKSLKDIQSFIKINRINFLVLPDRYFVNYPVEIDKVFASPSAVIKYPDQTPALKIFEIKNR